MSDEPAAPQPTRPTTNDADAWAPYWQAQGTPWRTEPEIDAQRQAYLAERRAITPDIAHSIYPFKDIEPKLTHADIEWLLATHESGGVRGPVRWEEAQRNRDGLDLRGADLRHVSLDQLPLARMRGALSFAERIAGQLTTKQLMRAQAHLEGATLGGAHLEGATLGGAHLEGADLGGAHLEEADLIGAHLERADLIGAHLERADLGEAHLERAILIGAHLQETSLSEAHLKGTLLLSAHLERADLGGAHLEGADLGGAHLEGADLSEAHLEGANLSRAILDAATSLRGINLGTTSKDLVSVADVRWGEANLAVIDWEPIAMLGDECTARQSKKKDSEQKIRATWLDDFRAAVRANRQLATALRSQGMNEEADRFAYRAQVCQRRVFRFQHKWLRCGFSWFLQVIAGYGYQPLLSVGAYVLIILGFMGLYLLNSQVASPHLRWDEALVLSVSSFHGRGFFSQNITLGDTYARLAAGEAIFGLIIEVSFIATFTQRFFGK